jgi:hypothetical protein
MKSNKSNIENTIDNNPYIWFGQYNKIVSHIKNINESLKKKNIGLLIERLRDFGLYLFRSFPDKSYALKDKRLGSFIPLLQGKQELQMSNTELRYMLHALNASRAYVMQIMQVKHTDQDELDLCEESLSYIVSAGANAYVELMMADRKRNEDIRLASLAAQGYNNKKKDKKEEGRLTQQEEDKVTKQLKILISKKRLQIIGFPIIDFVDKKSISDASFNDVNLDSREMINHLLLLKHAGENLADITLKNSERDLVISIFLQHVLSNKPLIKFDYVRKLVIESDKDLLKHKILRLNWVSTERDALALIQHTALLKQLMEYRVKAAREGQYIISDSDYSLLCDMILQFVLVKLAYTKKTTNSLKINYLISLEAVVHEMLNMHPMKSLSDIYQILYHNIFSGRQRIVENTLSGKGNLINIMQHALDALDKIYFKHVFHRDPPVCDKSQLAVQYQKYIAANYSKLLPEQLAAIRGIVSYIQAILNISAIKNLENKLNAFFATPLHDPVADKIFQLLLDLNEIIQKRDKKTEKQDDGFEIAALVQKMRLPYNVLSKTNDVVVSQDAVDQKVATPKQVIKQDLERIITKYADLAHLRVVKIIEQMKPMQDTTGLYGVVGAMLIECSADIGFVLSGGERQNELKEVLFGLGNYYMGKVESRKEAKTSLSSMHCARTPGLISTGTASAPTTSPAATTATTRPAKK